MIEKAFGYRVIPGVPPVAGRPYSRTCPEPEPPTPPSLPSDPPPGSTPDEPVELCYFTLVLRTRTNADGTVVTLPPEEWITVLFPISCP